MPAELDTFQLQMGQASQLAMSAAIFIMMLSVALGLKASDFLFIKKAPRLFTAGFLGQMIGLPGLTIGLCYLLSPHPGIALGMILIACCPGGNVSNILVVLSRGNAALSVSLTAVSSVLAAFYTPIAIIFWSNLYAPTASMLNEIQVDVYAFLLQTTAILAVPLAIGMILAQKLPDFSRAVRGPLLNVGAAALGILIVVTTAKAGELIITVGSAIIGIVALHNACAYLLGYCIGVVVKADEAAKRSLTFEIGIQNAGLGIVIIMSQMGGLGATAAIAGLWGTWHIIAGFALLTLFRTIDKKWGDGHV